VIFVDTSAWYALTDSRDPNHGRAQQLFARLLEEQTPLLTHNYVVVESMSLIQNRLGLAAARVLADEMRAFTIVWIDEEIHQEASLRWANGRLTLSFVDSVSFVVMRRHEITTAFAFDSDFVAAGFNVVTATPRP
jgi:predicted nucleic acid-binding protein